LRWSVWPLPRSLLGIPDLARPGDVADSLLVCGPLTARSVVPGAFGVAVDSTHSASITRGVGCRTEPTSGRPCRRPIADLPALAAEQRVGIGHSRKNCTGSSHGKSVAACGGILYTSTSYLLRGRRSHEHQRPPPLPLRRPCSTRRPRTSSSSTLRS
jgi:hypothetical protein